MAEYHSIQSLLGKTSMGSCAAGRYGGEWRNGKTGF